MSESDNPHLISAVNIEDEMKQSYMDYAMSVIVRRALPDVRDGLKPVHRRVLYAMSEMGNDWNKAYKKSARIVGDVIGKYHPHGDTAVYDTIVRMAQPFSLRYVLVDGQGNFGSVDGDSPAAMRYTEIRMTRIAHEVLADLDKETVDFAPNYDTSEHEPTVLPARIPNLLINGSSGIAVGMATNIPPHNLSEVIRATTALIDDDTLDMNELIKFLPGPDFPTGGFINGSYGIREAYATGRGKIYVRARLHVKTDEDKNMSSIIVTELPYQVNKARLMEHIAELVKAKKISGIRELRDESDKDGMRMVIDLRSGEVPDVLINNLYKYTQMQSVFGINIVALKDGQPQLLNLKQLLVAFIQYRKEVVTRRTHYELRKSKKRAHILEGLAVALSNIDEMIVLIKASPTPAEAKQALLEPHWQATLVMELLGRADTTMPKPDNLSDEGYRLSEVQAQAILDLKLQRLTGLERDKIVQEYSSIMETIRDLLDILSRSERLMQVIRDELSEVVDQYGDERRTEILETQFDLSMEDLIPKERVIVTLSHAGYAKSQLLDTYRSQRRGGRGKSATNMKNEDFIDKLFVADTHDILLCFSSKGKLYCPKVYQLPRASRTARGQPIVNLLQLEDGERISAVLPVSEFADDRFALMATARGTVKKCKLTDFSRPRTTGIRAITLVDDDQLIGVELTDGTQDIMLFSDAGKVMRFNESAVRTTGRTAQGVRGIRLGDGQRVNSLIVLDKDAQTSILTVTENGYGKRTAASDYPTKGRAGQGVISIQTTERNGHVVGAIAVLDDDEVALINDQGTLIRMPVKDVSVISRNTQGVTLVRLNDDQRLVSLELLVDDHASDADESADANADEVTDADVA